MSSHKEVEEDDDLDFWNGAWIPSHFLAASTIILLADICSQTHMFPSFIAAGPPRVAPPAPPADSTTSDESSDAESEDSAAARARAAEARLRDHNEPSAPPASAVVLPSAADAFGAVAGPPAFLNPEATRQLLEVHRTAAGSAASAAGTAAEEDAPAPRQRQHGDISRLAPRLPKSDRERESEGVLQAGAKRQKAEGGLAVDVATAAAMLGGGEMKRDRGKATAAQGVEDFLASGGAPLPRKRQERKDREKEKRAKGQSSHAEWKSEAEMALRQQYD